jgi:hypothetical protein
MQLAFEAAEVRLVGSDFMYLMHERGLDTFGLLMLSGSILEGTLAAVSAGEVTFEGHCPRL